MEHLNKSSPRKRGSGNLLILKSLDDSLRSPSGRSTRYAPLSRLRGNDRLVQTFPMRMYSTAWWLW